MEIFISVFRESRIICYVKGIFKENKTSWKLKLSNTEDRALLFFFSLRKFTQKMYKIENGRIFFLQ
jgi:hypothetical protein